MLFTFLHREIPLLLGDGMKSKLDPCMDLPSVAERAVSVGQDSRDAGTGFHLASMQQTSGVIYVVLTQPPVHALGHYSLWTLAREDGA